MGLFFIFLNNQEEPLNTMKEIDMKGRFGMKRLMVMFMIGLCLVACSNNKSTTTTTENNTTQNTPTTTTTEDKQIKYVSDQDLKMLLMLTEVSTTKPIHLMKQQLHKAMSIINGYIHGQNQVNMLGKQLMFINIQEQKITKIMIFIY